MPQCLAPPRFGRDVVRRPAPSAVAHAEGRHVTTPPSPDRLLSLVGELRREPQETDWLEFKVNDAPKDIGEYISALSNAAALAGGNHGYLLWGIDDASHDVVGTRFSPARAKKGAEPLQNWLHRLLTPSVDFAFHELVVDGRKLVLLIVPKASHRPIAFRGRRYVRTGAGPMMEIFEGRIEISNPGEPLVDTQRFVDAPPTSRNEVLASLMRRFRLCEERGSGIDRVLSEIEQRQLPAPLFEATPRATRVVLFDRKSLAEMDGQERLRACYLHACLQFVTGRRTTNGSLRERLGVRDKNASMVSRILGEAVNAGLIVVANPENGLRSRHYVPFWASRFGRSGARVEDA